MLITTNLFSGIGSNSIVSSGPPRAYKRIDTMSTSNRRSMESPGLDCPRGRESHRSVQRIKGENAMGNPESQRVVITGISRGIGRATALAFARQGAQVAGLHRNKNPRVTTEIEGVMGTGGGEPLIHVGNVSSTADIERLAAAVANEWGGIDTWVNNAAQLFLKPLLHNPHQQ